MSRPIPLYVTSTSITPEHLTTLQEIFDTAQDYPEAPARQDLIKHVPNSEWTHNALISDIFARNRREGLSAGFAAKPVVIADERTSSELSRNAEEVTVLLVGPDVDDAGEWKPEPVVLRFVAGRVPVAAVNVQLSNQSMEDLQYHLDDDAVWRKFKSRAESG
jgi:hypothetical protein